MCYLCNSPVKPFLQKNTYTIVRCDSCGLAQTVLLEDYLRFVKRNYQKGYFTGDPARSAYVSYKDDKPYIVRNMTKIFRRIQSIKPQGRVLDVGCAMGFFIELCLEKGYEVVGFDVSQYAIAEAKQLTGSNRVRVGTIDSVQYKPKSFDAITLMDVFEHLEDPRGNIQRLSTFLKDDGILVLATGDTSSFLAKVLKRRWTFYIPPQHLFFFNGKNLTTLLHQAGFTPITWFRVGKWLSLRYVLHLARTTGESRFAKWIYPLIASSRLGKLPLYLPVRDNMVVIAKKSV